jgi:hypothetical protein
LSARPERRARLSGADHVLLEIHDLKALRTDDGELGFEEKHVLRLGGDEEVLAGRVEQRGR